MPVMAAVPVMVPVFVVGLPQLPASIFALPDMDATVMLPDTSPTVMLACPLISAFAASNARDGPRDARQIPGTGPSLPTHTAARRRFLVNAAAPRPWPRRFCAHRAAAHRAGDRKPNLPLTKTG